MKSNYFLPSIRLMLLFWICLLISSCSNKNELESIYSNNQSYLQKIENLKNTAFCMDILPDFQTKASSSDEPKRIKVILPVDESDFLIDTPEIELVSNLNDLQGIVRNYAADLVIANDADTSKRIILVSETKIANALNPMINESKNYLYSIGLTDSDIQEMVLEAETDESALIPFALAIMEHDNNCYLSWIDKHKIMLINNAYAATWADAGHCALQALGADIFWSFGTSVAKTWAKTAIKRAFKEAAKKMIGPVGVAITVVEFSICMWG